MTGKIIKGIAGFYYVLVIDYGIYECKARGIFRKEGIKPLVGDNVDIEITDKNEREGNIVSIHDRKNTLIRPRVANVDRALIIMALASPSPNYSLLDKMLVMMEYQKLPITICFNKSDLCDEKSLAEIRDIYDRAGYDIIVTSTKTQEGLERLRLSLKNRITVVAGPSGVGKSSIINTLQTDVAMEIGEVSKKTKRGKHTTRHSEIIPIRDDSGGVYGSIIDTPGFSAIDIPDITAADVRMCYPEMREANGQCYFAGCTHVSEPNCEVKRLLEEGEISPVRYNNYVSIYKDLTERASY